MTDPAPSTRPLGSVLREGDRIGLRYRRTVRHPPERVWRALTESEHLAAWLPADLVGERRAGAALAVRFWPELVAKYGIADPELPGRIVVWDPPRVFEWTWDVDVLRWQLEPAGDDGTVLTFTTWLGERGTDLVDTAAGYHLCLDHLVALLDGERPGGIVSTDPAPWVARYRLEPGWIGSAEVRAVESPRQRG